MRVAYADPPYPGCAHLYAENAEVDHAELVSRLVRDYDGWLLHTSSVALRAVLPLCPLEARVMAWVKPFAAFKRNVSVAYAWEPVIVKPCRKPVVRGRIVMRDWVAESITLKRGMAGVKPEKVCRWAFEMLGLEPGDELIDLYPGTLAVTKAWKAWQAEFRGTHISPP